MNVSSIVLLEQIRTLDKQRLKERMGNLPENDMDRIDKALINLVTKEGYLRVLPYYMDKFGGADGFFAACLRKEK